MLSSSFAPPSSSLDHRALFDEPLVGDARPARRGGRAGRWRGRPRRPTTARRAAARSVLPVRERPPSMKNSWVKPSLHQIGDVACGTPPCRAGRRTTCAGRTRPARRNRKPNGPNAMFSRAAMCGGSRWCAVEEPRRAIRKSKYERWLGTSTTGSRLRVARRPARGPSSSTDANRRRITAPTTMSRIARKVELMFAAISRNIFSASRARSLVGHLVLGRVLARPPPPRAGARSTISCTRWQRLQHRALDHALLAVEEEQDRAADLARDARRALGRGASPTNAVQVDRLAHLHVQARGRW